MCRWLCRCGTARRQTADRNDVLHIDTAEFGFASDVRLVHDDAVAVVDRDMSGIADHIARSHETQVEVRSIADFRADGLKVSGPVAAVGCKKPEVCKDQGAESGAVRSGRQAESAPDIGEHADKCGCIIRDRASLRAGRFIGARRCLSRCGSLCGFLRFSGRCFRSRSS